MLKHVAATPHVNHMTYSLSQRSAHMLTCSYADMFVNKLRVQKLEADLLTYFPSLFNMASELLSEAELQTAWNQLSVLRPQLDEECEFQLESCKEVLRFVQFMWKDYKQTAHGVAIAITACVAFRSFASGGSFADTRYVDNLVYDSNAGPLPMLHKIDAQGFPAAMIERKIEESRAALKYLETIITHEGQGRIFVGFHAAYQVIADSLCHLQSYWSTVDLGDGKLQLRHARWN